MTRPHLVPCPSCARHVRVSDVLCPFCATALPEDLRASAPRALPPAGMSRAARYALGVALATATAAAPGCSTSRSEDAGVDLGGVMPLYGAAADGGTDAGVDLGGPIPMYGAAADAGADAARPDAGTDLGVIAPPYGIAPADAGEVDLGAPVAHYGGPPR